MVIPYCVRCHNLNTLMWSLPTYHHLFKGPLTNTANCGYLSPVTIYRNEERLLPKPEELLGQHFRRSFEHTEDDRQMSEKKQEATTTLPLMTTTACARFSEPHIQKHALFPTNLIEWNNPNARSVSRDCSWLKEVECIVLPLSWCQNRHVTKHLAFYFSFSQWYDHKNKEENPWDYLNRLLGLTGKINHWKH